MYWTVLGCLAYYNCLNEFHFFNNAVSGSATTYDYACEIVNCSIDSSNKLSPFAKEWYKAIISLTKPKIMLR